MLLCSMRMAAPPTACSRAWLNRRRARANGLMNGVRRRAAVAPQVVAALEVGGLAQQVSPEELEHVARYLAHLGHLRCRGWQHGHRRAAAWALACLLTYARTD